MTDSDISFLGATQANPNPLDRVAQADREHGLTRILQDVNDAASGMFEKDVPAVREQVILGGGGHGFDQTLTEFTLEIAKNASDFLQRESTAAKFADDSHFGKFVEGIEALVTFAAGYDDAALIPPLQLTQADTGDTGNVAGCQGRLQVKDPETKVPANV